MGNVLRAGSFRPHTQRVGKTLTDDLGGDLFDAIVGGDGVKPSSTQALFKGSATAGKILYASGKNTLSDTSMTWDSTNKRLGVDNIYNSDTKAICEYNGSNQLTLFNATDVTVILGSQVNINSPLMFVNTDLRKDGRLFVASYTYTSSSLIANGREVVVFNSSSALTGTLEAATGSSQKLIIKNIGAGNLTLEGDGTDTIDGELTQVLLQNTSLTLYDYASGVWLIL